MNKKSYIAPDMSVMEIANAELLAGSPSSDSTTSGGDTGGNPGGGGHARPSSFSLWDGSDD